MFSPAELTRLATIDPRGQLLLRELDGVCDFVLLEGARTLDAQKANVAKGVSKTLDSKHVRTPSLAWDIAPSPLLWPDEAGITPAESAHRVKRFHVLAGLMLGIAHARGVPLIWGGDWDRDFTFNDQKFHDLPHFEIKE
jgi:peptidoglycan L-alanyl-D-glutamate endopeptidase CwlK